MKYFSRLVELFDKYSVLIKFWMMGYHFKILKIYLKQRGQALVLFTKYIYLVRNRLLYLPVKYQGRATAWTKGINKFQWLLKMWKCFFILAVYDRLLWWWCDILVCSWHLKRLFVKLVKSICKTMHLCRTSSLEFFCTQLIIIIITVKWTFVQTDRPCSAPFVKL